VETLEILKGSSRSSINFYTEPETRQFLIKHWSHKMMRLGIADYRNADYGNADYGNADYRNADKRNADCRNTAYRNADYCNTDYRNAGLSCIQSVRYRTEKDKRCRNRSGTGIKRCSPAFFYCGTGLR
jgi:hypothetical protein